MSASDWPMERDEIYGCELWTGSLTANGYPRLPDRSSAHRVAWEARFGAIPAEQVLDHLCRRRRCVNLDHLEAVTKSENERRKSMRYRLQRKSCRRGHVLTEVTRLVTPELGVLCRQCLVDARRGGGV